MDNRSDIRDFLTTRRARISPEQAGLLPGGGRRRVPGLRREEVAVLAGVSTDWYTRLEKGHITGVSEDVLEAVARALQLDEAERTYLFDLARAAARPRGPQRRSSSGSAPIEPRVQWMLDSMTGSAAFVADGRLDIVATNSLGWALHAPLFDNPRGTANFARFQFLDPRARDFYPDWAGAASVTVALLRTEAGRRPHDAQLRELVGELSTVSEEFRVRWAAHDVRIHHNGAKQFQHPVVGSLDLTYRTLDLSGDDASVRRLTIYTAEPGSPSEDALKLLASWAATADVQAPRPAPGARTD
ncbi:helix-turn-helix transcriptional regulator [Modestobacter versicolor]|uniref:Transcriptional regulator n=1 Tax=Modestobacter versicolor TaxID=429133 RepID=A0A323VD37_9ACTN|nr:helix-turn-helix transcriptional regulator [Modestobacter versicolor]MBB3674801.1 transcriptional regulator with XRE-family HTH domain [Modestobacter versicolor]PZA22090.1 transcriptional regulator [Modestobacter versicolor]